MAKRNIPQRVRGEGGGGCFYAGTKVSTPGGPVSIENIAVGDEVYAYDIKSLEPGEVTYPGRVTVRKVTQVFKHSWDEVGATSVPLTITHDEGTLRTTGNHYILTSSRKSAQAEADIGFVRADELQVGDILYTRYGQPSLVKGRRKGAQYDFVYNLEVEGDHTYIADKIRVHNGGGGKGSHTPVQAADTVRTNQMAKVLLCPTEGVSAGLWDVFINGGYGSAGDTLINRSKSIYFGGTQVINSDGQYEFSNISVQQRVGLPSQSIIEGFSTTESEYVTGLPIKIRKYNTQYKGEKEKVTDLPPSGNTLYDMFFVKTAQAPYMWNGTAWVPTTGTGAVTPGTSSGVTSSPLDASIDAVRVTIDFPNGLQVLDQKTGDTSGSSVQLKFSRRLSGGTWVQISTPTIKEMSSGAFIFTTEIHRPTGTGTWEFKVERLTNDTTSNLTRDDTSLKSYTRIQETKYNPDGSVLFAPTYDNRALVGIQLSADSTNGSVPAIALDFGGVLVKVPDIYTTRRYNKDWTRSREASWTGSGGWGGTFKSSLEWTDNPAWLLYDLLTNDRYGLGNGDTGSQFRVDPAMVDTSSFWEASKYCDELVDDGLDNGLSDTSEPRFTFNGQLMVREDAWKTLQTFASSFNAKLYNHGGMIRLTQDRPQVFTKIFNNTNVLGGLFSYAYTDAINRFCQCNVTFNDPKDNFLPKVVSHTDQTGLNRYGLQTVNQLAYGAAGEGQARRAAKWAVYTSLNTTAMISFGVSIRHADLEPGEVFKVLDYSFAQAYQEGAVVSVSGSTVTLDQPLVKTAGGVWTIDFIGSDGVTIETRTITNGVGTFSTITLNSPTTAIAGSPWVITGSAIDQVKPMLFRVVGLTENDGGTWSVTAVQYDPNKYAFIETGNPVPPTIYFQQPSLTSLAAPTNLVITTTNAINPDGIVFRRFEMTWSAPADGTATGYTVQYRKDGGFLTTIATSLPYALIPADIDGEYEFYINAKNAAGVTSPTLSGTYELTTVSVPGSKLSPVSNLGEFNTGGSIFSTTDLAVKWLNPGYNGPVKNFEVRVLDKDNALLRTEIVPSVPSGQYQSFIYTFDMNVKDGGPNRNITIQVYINDTSNMLTVPAERAFSNPAPGVPTDIKINAGFGNNFIRYRLPTDPDFEGVLVWASTASDFIPTEASLIRDGTDTFFPHTGVLPNTTYYYRLASYDSFGKDYTGVTLNTTAAFQVVSANIDFDLNKLINSSFELVQQSIQPGTPGIGNAINRPIAWVALSNTSTYTLNTGRNSANSVGVKSTAANSIAFGIRTLPEDGGGAVNGYEVGKNYVISVWAKKGAGLTDGAGIALVFTDDYPATVTNVLLNPTLNTTWQRWAWNVRWDYTIASGGRADFKVVKSDGSNATIAINDIIVFDDAQTEQGDVLTDYAPRVGELGPGSITETLIAPGSITTPKIVANAIIGSLIQGDTIDAHHLQVYSVTADAMAINTLDAIVGNFGSPTATTNMGSWNAATNSPLLENGVYHLPLQGRYYTVSVGGNTVLGKVQSWTAGDIAYNNGSNWVKYVGTPPATVGGGVYAGYIHGATISGGDFTHIHGWPATGTGFQLSSDGLKLGNYNTGPFFEVTYDGSINSPKMSYSAATGELALSGSLYVGTPFAGGSSGGILIDQAGDVYSRQFSIVSGNATFLGALSAASGTFSGSLTAEVITAANIIGGEITSTYAAASTGGSASVTVTIPTGARSIVVMAGFGGISGVTYTGSGKDGSFVSYTRGCGGDITSTGGLISSSTSYSSLDDVVQNPTPGTYTITATRETGGTAYYGKCSIVVLLARK